MITSGPPMDWEFKLFDPVSFRAPERKVKRVFLHNTGWDNMAFNGTDLAIEINRWQMSEGARGISYHYIIDKAGNIVTGRSLEDPPFDGKASSEKTIIIIVQGQWHFTEPQLRSAQVLCKCISETYHDEGRDVSFHGMCEIINIPSPMFDYTRLLHLDSEGHMGSLQPEVASDVANRASLCVPVVGTA